MSSGPYWSYNGVELAYIKTHSVVTTTERDASDTDQVWTRRVVRVQGIIFPAEGIYSSFGDSPAKIYRNISHLLSIDRRPFVFQHNGEDIVRCDAPPDANKGPKIETEITDLLEGSWMITCTVTTFDANCGDGRGVGDGMISHRYNQTEKFDQNHCTYFSVRGKIKVRSDLRVSADSLRGTGIPRIPDGKWIRKNLQVTLSDDGLELDYSFEDVQQHAKPPTGATKATGNFQVYSANGAKWMGQATVRLEGPPTVDRKALAKSAMFVALDKLIRANVLMTGTDKGTPVVSGSITEGLYGESAVVDVVLVGQLTNQNVSVKNMASAMGFGVTPRQTLVAISPSIRQKLQPLLAAAFLDPCGADSTAGATEASTQPMDIRTGPPSDDTSSDGILSTDTQQTTAFSTDDPADYDSYKIESRYIRNEGRAQLPSTGNYSKACTVVRMHNPTMKLVVSWTAKRRGKAAILPAYFSPDPNLKELGGDITPCELQEGADGFSQVYTVSGRYEYAVVDPSQVSVFAPVPPFMSTTSAQGAKEATGYVNNDILFRFQGSDGPNPLDKQRAGVGLKPTGALSQQIANGINLGLPGGGLPSDGGGVPTGSMIGSGPPVNA